jgi:ribosomal protein S18 acetylase RimI-like enzyme
MGNPDWEVVPATEVSSFDSFDCGSDNLNLYLKRYARQNHRKDLGRTFVALEKGSRKVAGYYTLSMAQMNLTDIPETRRKHLPKYPVPAVRLARLAVAADRQGKGLGAELLMDAFHRAVFATRSVAAMAMIVDVQDEQGRGFYQKYGFMTLEGEGNRLFLPIETIRRLFRNKP